MYRKIKYDLREQITDESFSRACRLRCLGSIVFSKSVDVLELPEPYWVREWPFTLFLAAVSRLTHPRRKIVTFAIENADADQLMHGLPGMVASAFKISWRIAGRILFDRIAFGSDQAQTNYKLLQSRRLESRRFLMLPARPKLSTGSDVDPTGSESHRVEVAFVGELSRRKGVFDLMQAWEVLEPQTTARIVFYGDGPSAEAVKTWALANPKRRLAAGWVPNSEVTDRLMTARVLVAPSRPEGRWREQIGLPILDGLSAGVEIVTTEQTGLATWLRANGHQVVPWGDVEQLANAVSVALGQSRGRDCIKDQLPDTSGEVMGRRWMMTGD